MKITFLSGIFNGRPNKFQPTIVYYWLRSFFETTKPHLKNKIKWSKPLYYEEQIEDYINYVLKENPDLLCSTVYIWNVDLHYLICKKVKERNPKIKIVLGGPEINAKNIGENFERFPIVDAVVYGDGEESFAEMLEEFLETGKIRSGINRAISKNDTGYYRRFQYKNYPPYSFYTEYKQELLEDFADIKEKFQADKKLQITTEYMRGCPYGCTFCDWDSGLHHKVSKRDLETVKRELIFLQETFGDSLGMYWCDANWGLGNHYDELTNFMIDNNVVSHLSSWTKKNKWQSFELWKHHMMHDDFQPRRNIAIQSPKTKTLEAINRPEELTWEEQLEYIQAHEDYIKELNESKKFNIRRKISFEFIHDLPLMTLEDYKKLFRDMNRFVNCDMLFFDWVYLPNSPAADPKYLEKYGLEVVKTGDLTDLNAMDLSEAKKNFNAIDLSKPKKNFRIIIDKSKRYERMFVKLMTYIYNYKNDEGIRSKESQQLIENHMDEIYDIAENLAIKHTKQFNGRYCDLFKMNGKIVTSGEVFFHVYIKLVKDYIFS